MASTPDYNDQASSYSLKFSAQNRSGTITPVTSNEIANRDNLLYFIEDKFKTNVKGGFKLENIRAFLHSLVKSVPILADDKSYGVLMNTSFYISSSANNRWYFGSQTQGWNSYSWSQYTTNTVSSVSIPSVTGLYANMGVDVPFELSNFKVFGTILNLSQTGDIDIELFYYDSDEGAASNLENGVHICTVPTITCAAASTSYAFESSASPSLKIPKGKKVFAFIQNRGHGGGGTETLRVTMGYQYSRHSPNFTV